jgi:hypothetical protein
VRRGLAFGLLFAALIGACAPSAQVGRATIETDDPTVKAYIFGSASISANAAGWTLTLTNLRSGESDCEAANRAAADNVSGLFQLSVHIPSNGDLTAGSQSNATATFSVTDATCSSTIGEVSVDVQVQIDALSSGSWISGDLRVHFPSGLFVATWDARECSPPSPDLASCQTLPACPTGGGGSLLCIDG